MDAVDKLIETLRDCKEPVTNVKFFVDTNQDLSVSDIATEATRILQMERAGILTEQSSFVEPEARKITFDDLIK